MGGFSILNGSFGSRRPENDPVFYEDFNLNQVLDLMCIDWGREVRDLFFDMPESIEHQEYRRGVYLDIKKKGVLEAFTEYHRGMKKYREYASYRVKMNYPVQRRVWYLRETQIYLQTIKRLYDALRAVELESEGCKGLLGILAATVESELFTRGITESEGLFQELLSFRVSLIYEKNRIEITEGKGSGDYSDMLQNSFLNYRGELQNPFAEVPELEELEAEVIRIFSKKHKDFFERLEAFENGITGYTEEVYDDLYREIPYYLAAHGFVARMNKAGFVFATPRVFTDRLSAAGLYDIALACANSVNGKKVVDNCVELDPCETFFVLTGPNQGGKTTFARSLGQLVWFTKMGLDVPAESAEVPFYRYILTHFSVEESVETGRGKLMEELVRLRPMMRENVRDSFVVINELFTTAANYDCCIMGQRVLRRFIDNGCKGIYVTHLKELTECDPSIVSLRACLDENMVQSYRIERSESQDIAGANIQVEKYHLTYEMIKERFA